MLGSENSVAGEEGAATEGVVSADVNSIPENSISCVCAAILNYTLGYHKTYQSSAKQPSSGHLGDPFI